MLAISNDDLEKIKAVIDTNERLDARILEKDILVTRAITALNNIGNENIKLIFCGGTCLSKAYHQFLLRGDLSLQGKEETQFFLPFLMFEGIFLP